MAGSRPAPGTLQADPRLTRLRMLGHLLDNSIPIPGTRRRIGLDALIGLVPGVGDSTGAVLSGYIVIQAARFGAPFTTLLRMIGNVALESVVGVIPIIGDLFDAAYKANSRNLAMLDLHLERHGPTLPTSNRRVAVLVGGLLLALFLTVVALALWVGRFVARNL